MFPVTDVIHDKACRTSAKTLGFPTAHPSDAPQDMIPAKYMRPSLYFMRGPPPSPRHMSLLSALAHIIEFVTTFL